MDELERLLRDQTIRLLRGGMAHMTFDDALADFPLDRINERPPGVPYPPSHPLGRRADDPARTAARRRSQRLSHRRVRHPAPGDGHLAAGPRLMPSLNYVGVWRSRWGPRRGVQLGSVAAEWACWTRRIVIAV